MKSYYLKRKIKTIGKHINNVLKEELDNQVVVAKFTTVQNEGTTMLVLIKIFLSFIMFHPNWKLLVIRKHFSVFI